MKIKGIVIFCLATLLSFSVVMPALAVEKNANSVDTVKKAAATYQPRAVTVRGNITAISGTTLPLDITVSLEKITPIKLKNFPGTFPIKGSAVVIHLTSDVKIVRKYMGKATVSEFAAGDKVSVTGKLQADGAVSAGMVKNESIHVAFNAKRGDVVAIDYTENTFVIKNNNKDVKVYVTANTKFIENGVTKPALADLKVGDVAVVRGVVRQTANEVTADSVTIKIGGKEQLTKQLESKKTVLENRIESLKSNLIKLQADLEALLKKLSEAANAPTVTVTP